MTDQPVQPVPPVHQAPPEPERMRPVAALAALLLPGAGQFVLGERRRGVLAAVGVLGLFLGGLLIGGIDVVDSRENPFWFVCQVMVGPVAIGVDQLHQGLKIDTPGEPPRAPSPDANPAYSMSLGKMNELGTLFCAIAGLLNVIVILDAAFHGPAREGAA